MQEIFLREKSVARQISISSLEDLLKARESANIRITINYVTYALYHMHIAKIYINYVLFLIYEFMNKSD